MIKGAMILLLISVIILTSVFGYNLISRAIIVTATNPIAECADGTYSTSSNRRGACSQHGGVKGWVR